MLNMYLFLSNENDHNRVESIAFYLTFIFSTYVCMYKIITETNNIAQLV